MQYRGRPIKVVSSESTSHRHAQLSVLEGRLDTVLAGCAGAGLGERELARRFDVHRGDTSSSAPRAARGRSSPGVHVAYTNDIGSVLFERAILHGSVRRYAQSNYELYLKDRQRRARDPAARQ